MRAVRTAPLLVAVLLAGCGGAGPAGPAAPPSGLVTPAKASPDGAPSTAETDALGSAILHGRPLCSLPEAAGVATFVLPGDGADAAGGGLGPCADEVADPDRDDATRPAGASPAAGRAASR